MDGAFRVARDVSPATAGNADARHPTRLGVRRRMDAVVGRGGNEALWVNAYRRAADIFRLRVADLPLSTGTAIPVGSKGQTSAYPGDNYVDIVGMDLYDKGSERVVETRRRAHGTIPRPHSPPEIPNLRFGRGLRRRTRQAGSAIRNGALAKRAGAESPKQRRQTTTPAFIQGMYDWMSSPSEQRRR